MLMNNTLFFIVLQIALMDTVAARQKGFPQRVVFQEFLRR